MAHQDFEKYAQQRAMNGMVSERYRIFFETNALPLLKTDFKVLDFGCGDGKYFNFFNQFTKQKNIFGIEISQTRVTRCHKMGWRNVIKIDPLEPLPFADASFDLINFDQVIEHIRIEDIQFYLAELRRILVNGGSIVILTPNYPTKRFYDIYNAFLGWNLNKIKDDPTHVTTYNFKKLKFLLSDYFEIVKLEPTGGIFWEHLRYDFMSCKIVGILRKVEGSYE